MNLFQVVVISIILQPLTLLLSSDSGIGEYHNRLGCAALKAGQCREAKKEFEEAIDHNNIDALNNLGGMYYSGFGVHKNYARARRLFEQAAHQNHPDALHNLGCLYFNGYGVTQSYEIALSFYKKAASAGHKEAMLKLSICYYNGYGTSPNKDLALHWSMQAECKSEKKRSCAIL
jgi:TPR repeat protein